MIKADGDGQRIPQGRCYDDLVHDLAQCDEHAET
jgi:hypothetical protein